MIGVIRTAVRLEQDKSLFLSGIVNFKNFEEFISKIITNNQILHLENKKIFDPENLDGSIFDQPLKIGIRLVYVPAAISPKLNRNQLVQNLNKFKIKTQEGNIEFKILEQDLVEEQKTFYIFDKQATDKSDEDTEFFKQFNPISILEKEIIISDFINLRRS